MSGRARRRFFCSRKEKETEKLDRQSTEKQDGSVRAKNETSHSQIRQTRNRLSDTTLVAID